MAKNGGPFGETAPTLPESLLAPMKFRLRQDLQMSPPSGPDGAKILIKSPLGAQFLAQPRLAGPRTMTRSLGLLSWCLCAPWRKSSPAKTLLISLLTPLSRPVDRRLIID